MTTTTPSADVLSQSIELQLTGQSDAKYKYGAGHIRPERVVFYYIEDTKGSVNAHLFGSWVSEDGEATGDPVDQMYRHTDGDWPDWLTELSSRRKPALFNEVRRLWAKSDAADTTTAALADGLRYVLEYTGPRHNHDRPGIWDTSGKPCEHCARLTTIREHLTAYEAAPAAVLPQPADRAEDLVAEVAELTAAVDRATVYRELADLAEGDDGYVTKQELRRMAREAERDADPSRMAVEAQQQTETPVVAYRSPGTRALYCVICARQEPGWQPVTEVRDDAVCDFCGGGVLAVASQRLGDVVARHLPAVVAAAAGEAEDPARIDRLRPEFFEHSSVEAIDVQLRRARAQERRWHIRTEWLISLRQTRVKQKELGKWPAGEAQQPNEADGERVVAYRSALPGALSVYCTNHTDELGSGVTPLTSDDLPNGGMCASCGADVLIPPAPEPSP